MANDLKMDKVFAILALHEAGWSDRRIARELGIHRGTVGRHLRLVRAANPAAGSCGWSKPATNLPAGSDGSSKPATNPPTGSEGSGLTGNPAAGLVFAYHTHMWFAFYRQSREKKFKDCQLFFSVGINSMSFGFYVGRYASDVREAFQHARIARWPSLSC